MTRAPGGLVVPALLFAGLVSLAAGCRTDEAVTSPAIEIQAAATRGTGLSITAANPGYGKRGAVGLSVAITGSGFTSGASATWTRGGAPATGITVQSTTYISSTQLVAVIDISTAADLAYYDITVTQTGRKGIGTESATTPELFEVTQANVIAGTGLLRGVNDNGEITGQSGPIYWSEVSGLQHVDTATAGFAISAMGNAIVANSYPRLYTRPGAVGTAWQRTMLPVDAGASGGGAHAMLTDAATGQVNLIAGRVLIPAGRGKSYYKPRLWLWQPATGTWDRLALSTGSLNEANVRQVSRDSLVVGTISSGSTIQAAIWQPSGSGGWTLTTLGAGSAAYGIDRAATVLVGASGGAAAYWTRSGGVWTGPTILPAGCAAAKAVDDLGRIAADGCTGGSPAVVFVPPYASATAIRLGGLGKQNIAFVEGMAPSGGWVVGQAGGVGVYWRPF